MPPISAGQPPSTPAAGGNTPAAPAAPAQQPRNLFQAAAAAAQGTPGGAAATPSPAARGGGAGATGAGGADSAELEALRSNPLVAQLRQLVQQQPALLQPFLQQLSATNPQMFDLINRNQQAFLEFLTEGSGVDLGALMDDDDMMEGAGGAEGGAGGMRGDNVIQVTAEERDAIQRLESMGFDRQMVLQAFIACDRNEELA